MASACPSSAWVLGVVSVHSWQLALFPDQAQQDVWGSDSSTLISSSYMPVGTVQRTEGGYTLSG
ncbi:MAG: flavin-dependent monooxygenase, partial [Sandaracinaceae bacterium]|nr:flavin-dependent monooxygenase [Sandaracinaceae bacterium]